MGVKKFMDKHFAWDSVQKYENFMRFIPKYVTPRDMHFVTGVHGQLHKIKKLLRIVLKEYGAEMWGQMITDYKKFKALPENRIRGGSPLAPLPSPASSEHSSILDIYSGSNNNNNDDNDDNNRDNDDNDKSGSSQKV